MTPPLNEWMQLTGRRKGVGSRFQKITFAERMDAVDRAGILSFRGMKSLQPARQLILGVLPHAWLAEPW
jgi:hypothetical protein